MDENQLNNLIEINLEKIYRSQSQYIMRQNFSSLEKRQLPMSDQKILARYMCEFRLIEMQGEHRCNLTAFGRDVYNKGGWKEYLHRSEAENLAKNSKQLDENENLKLDLQLKRHSKKYGHFTIWLGVFVSVVTTAAAIVAIAQGCRQDKSDRTKPLPKEKTKYGYVKPQSSTRNLIPPFQDLFDNS